MALPQIALIDEVNGLDERDLDCFLEALLFVADGPAAMRDIARALGVDENAVEASASRLEARAASRGVRVAKSGRRLLMVTCSGAAPAIERFLGISNAPKLSGAALETLAVIAYRQPVTRAQVEAIRGVSSDSVVRTLLARSLVAVVGRLEQAGRPETLGTTFEFLQYFGIESLEQLPSLPDADAVQPSPAAALKSMRDSQVATDEDT